MNNAGKPEVTVASQSGPPANWRKNIALFLASQTVSLFGSTLVQYAITWYITLKTQSGIMMTTAIICGFLPAFLISPFAGVWADRYNRKILIIAADSFIAIATLIMALLFLAGYNAIWLLFVVSAVRSIGSGIHTPAIGAVLPQLVPQDKLPRMNAINGSIHSVVMLFSPMLSGALLTMATIETIFFIDVITAAIAVTILLLFVHVQTHAKAMVKQETGYFADLMIGIRYIREHGFLKVYFVFSAIFLFLVAPAAFLTPLQVTRTFGGDVWRLTAIEMVFSIGMLLGGMLMTFWSGFKNKVHTMALSNLLIGALTLSLGIIPVFWLYLIFMAFIGVTLPIFNTPAAVLLQQKVEPDFLGRVFGVLGMISSSMMPLGMLVFGPLADAIRIEWLLIGTGLLMFIEAVIMFGNRALVEAGRPVAGD